MISTREVTWGEALWLELKKAPGGLKATHQDILKLTGKHMGVRNTFSKLCRYNGPDELDEPDALRAWLLLTALRLDPVDWGISDDAIPPGFLPADELRRRLDAIRESRLGESNPRPIHYKNDQSSASGKIYRGRLRCA
jgi:hypothetical protein